MPSRSNRNPEIDREVRRAGAVFGGAPLRLERWVAEDESQMDGWPVWFRFVVAVLATWRVAHLVAREDGPFDVIVQLRARAGDGVVGRLMDCPYCLSLWMAMPCTFWLGHTWVEWLMGWLAVSGGASFLERSSRRTDEDPSSDGE